jgi:hypothetical protein
MVGIDHFIKERRFRSAQYYKSSAIERIRHRSIHIVTAIALGAVFLLSQNVEVISLVLGVVLFNLIKSVS